MVRAALGFQYYCKRSGLKMRSLRILQNGVDADDWMFVESLT